MLSLPEETVYSFMEDRDEDQAVHERLSTTGVPTLVMHGTEDLRVPFACGRYVAEQIPGARFYAFEGRGHLPMTTAIGEFCQVLRHFILTGETPPRDNMGKAEKD
jgi:pimeloyl-ACP methyl ester carboxylesterase